MQLKGDMNQKEVAAVESFPKVQPRLLASLIYFLDQWLYGDQFFYDEVE